MAKKPMKGLERSVESHSEQAIDTVLSTLFATDASGYHFLEPKVVKSEAIKRIRRSLESIDAHMRKPIEDRTRYRLEQFEEFSTLPERKREEVLRLAKERHITIEEAYEIAKSK